MMPHDPLHWLLMVVIFFPLLWWVALIVSNLGNIFRNHS
jgi:hypothetical protein